MVIIRKKTILNLTDQTELIRLRRGNEQLRMKREIIKKAAGDSTDHCNTADEQAPDISTI
jgi:hypothetical protein